MLAALIVPSCIVSSFFLQRQFCRDNMGNIGKLIESTLNSNNKMFRNECIQRHWAIFLKLFMESSLGKLPNGSHVVPVELSL